MKTHFSFLLLILLAVNLSAKSKPLTAFAQQERPSAPNYANSEHWSALPFRTDAADVMPNGEAFPSDSLKKVDVFYVYPTIYTKGKNWNADLGNDKLNKKIDEKPVHFQASVFNQVCRVYAPRYRQAIVNVFFEDSVLPDSKLALELAYQDVKTAFEYYLKHYNQGRPIIIAGHSQGSHHTRRLIKEYFDNQSPLYKQLVAAYVIGYHVSEKMYQTLTLCQEPNETGCFLTWMSYKVGHEPKWTLARGTDGVNPISWKVNNQLVPASESKGTAVLNLNKVKSGKTSAQLQAYEGGNILWVKTKRPLLRLLKNLHIADYNLFYEDIRQNVELRVNSFLAQQD